MPDSLLARARDLLRPKRRAIAATSAEVRDGIVPASAGIERPAVRHDEAVGTPGYRTVALIVASAMFMENLDATVLATALPTMARDFGVRATEMSIALTAYLLSLALFIPASGYMADRFGARPVFRWAIGLFMAGSVASGLSPNVELLALARFVQGIGGAMMLPVGRLVLLRSVSKADMVSAIAWLIMPALIGPILGPPVGGFIVTYLDWRWIFWLNIPIGFLGIWLIGRFIPDIPPEGHHPFDLWGFILSGLSLSCLLFSFEMASRSGDGAFALLLLAVGLASGFCYVLHARRTAYPILDLSLLRIPTFRLSLLGGSLARVTQGAQPYLLPLMMQLAFGMSAAQSGLVTVATAVGSFAMKAVAKPILRRFGFRTSLLVMGVLAPAFYALCGLFRSSWPMPAVYAVLIVSGFFMSFQFTAYNSIAYDEIPAERMSTATSFYSTFQQLMLSLGIGTAALTLHASTVAGHRGTPDFPDFTFAFFVVTGVSLLALIPNLMFAKDAGADMSGKS